MYSCVPAVIVPPRQPECTNTASPIAMTQGQVNAECGILRRTLETGKQAEARLGTCDCAETTWAHAVVPTAEKHS